MFLNFRLHFPVILTPQIGKCSPTMMGYTELIENSANNLDTDKTLRVYRNMRGCILEVNFEGLDL